MHILFLLILFSLFNVLYAGEFCEIERKTLSSEVKYTIQESIKVEDLDGHVIRIFKTETNHKNQKKNCEGLKILKTDFFGVSDYINKSGSVYGYSIATYEDGSKIFSKINGTAQSPMDQSKNGIVMLTITITGGTGKYKGVIGFGNGKTEFNPETGYSAGTTRLSYYINK